MAVNRKTYRYSPVAEETVRDLSHPDCSGGEVTFTVFQKTVETPLSVRTTATVTGAARCAGSGQELPVVSWSDEMERAFQRVRAAAPLAPTSFAWTPQGRLVYRIFLFGIPLLAVLFGAALALSSRMIPTALETAQERVDAVAAAPKAGDLLQLDDGGSASAPAYRWYVIRSVGADTVELQGYDERSVSDFAVPDLAMSRFTGSSLSAPRAGFLDDHVVRTADRPILVVNASAP